MSTQRIVANLDNSIYYPTFNLPFQTVTSGDRVICPCKDENGSEITVEAYVSLKELKKVGHSYEWLITLYCDKVYIYNKADPDLSVKLEVK